MSARFPLSKFSKQVLSASCSVLKSCDFPAGAAKVCFACYFGIQKLRFSSWSCGSALRVQLSYLKAAIKISRRSCESVLRAQKFRRSCESALCALLSYLKVTIFKSELRKCTSPTTFILKSCDFRAGAAADQRGESNPRPRDCESRRASHETASKNHFASKKIDTARALRHARSPQRVRRD